MASPFCWQRERGISGVSPGSREAVVARAQWWVTVTLPESGYSPGFTPDTPGQAQVLGSVCGIPDDYAGCLVPGQ